MASSGTEEDETSAAGPTQMVKVKRNLLAACMTCPICNKLIRDATTISECLHTFCRKCIFEKLDEDETDCCPVCNIHLGCLPVEKLRADHNLQDLRSKIFPIKKPKVGASDSAPSVTLPVRRKEISLSSLVVNTPRVTIQPGPSGRRKKTVVNRASTHHVSESYKNEDDTTDKFAMKSNLNGNSTKHSLNRRQAAFGPDNSNNDVNQDTGNSATAIQDKAELWKPLNCLVEAANRTKSFRSTPQNSFIKAEQKEVPDGEISTNKTRVTEHIHKSKSQDEKHRTAMTIKARRLKSVSQKRRNIANSSQTIHDASKAQSDKRTTPFWFSLVSSVDQAGGSSFPQISTNYLRIKDGNIPVSYIQKYLVKKLNLFNEDEVEITCRNEPVMPTVSLNNVVAQWLQGAAPPSQRLPAIIGTSAKDFIVMLGYRPHRVEVAAQ